MNKQNKKNSICWTDYTWNPIIGCSNNCSYCYARKMNKMFQFIPNWNEPVFFDKRLSEPEKIKKPSKIFVCSMGDMFGDNIPTEWIMDILDVINNNPKHTFQLLTKNYIRLILFFAVVYFFPKNCWVGVTVNTQKDWNRYKADCAIKGPVKFISIEPMQERINLGSSPNIDWIIVGPQTRPDIQPKKEWVDYLKYQCYLNHIPLWMKNTLVYDGERIQEYPKVKWDK